MDLRCYRFLFSNMFATDSPLGEHPLRSPGDLRHHRLIHDNFRIDWATWLERAGLDDINPNSGVMFDSAAYAVEAAVQGEGVLLGRSALPIWLPGDWCVPLI
jgi:DNA-binding transcriptional LysR family regulator